MMLPAHCLAFRVIDIQRRYARLLLYRLAKFSQLGRSGINTRESFGNMSQYRGKKSDPSYTL